MMNKNKRGYSLVEVVIALTVIVIVSISAISIMLSSITTKQHAINKSYAQNFADNVWECFKAANNEDEFSSLVKSVVGITEDPTADNGITTYTYESTKNKFTAIITVAYDSRPTLTIEVTESDDDKIISFKYTKGG